MAGTAPPSSSATISNGATAGCSTATTWLTSSARLPRSSTRPAITIASSPDPMPTAEEYRDRIKSDEFDVASPRDGAPFYSNDAERGGPHRNRDRFYGMSAPGA